MISLNSNISPFFPLQSFPHRPNMAPSRTSPAPSSMIQRGLSKEQLATFERDGYLLIPDALDPTTVSSLLHETHSMLENFSLDDHPMTKFSTGEGANREHVGDDYFLSSGDQIRFFFEEGEPPPTPKLPLQFSDSNKWFQMLLIERAIL